MPKNGSKRKPNELDRLVELVRRLRSKNGCPWDRIQTHRSLIKYLREETEEVAAALRGGRAHIIEDELGDLLLQILLHAEIGREKSRFDIQTVARRQRLKLTRRHPHVFGARTFKDADDVLANWKEVKDEERRLWRRDLAREKSRAKRSSR